MMTWIWIGHPNVILVEFTASETNCQAWKRSRPLYPKKRGRKSRTLPHNHNNEALSEKEKEAQREIFAASPQIKTANFQMNEPSCIVYYFKSESRKQNDRDFFFPFWNVIVHFCRNTFFFFQPFLHTYISSIYRAKKIYQTTRPHFVSHLPLPKVKSIN